MEQSDTPAPSPSRLAVLALDLGQTRLKVAAFDLTGRLLGCEVTRNTEHRRGSLHWQDPREWWANVGRLSRRLVARPELAGTDVAVIGVSGRGNALVPIDADGEPLTESWSDLRHADQLHRLARERADAEGRGGGEIATSSGDGIRPARQIGPLARYLWLRDTVPATAARVARLLFAKDWLVFRLCGRAVTDPSSGPDAADFDRPGIAAAGVDPGLFPDVAVPWSQAGVLRRDAADHLGLPAALPVSVGGHDGICANLGAGAGGPGGSAVTLGTNVVVRAVTTDVPPGTFRFYGMPPGRHVIGQNAGRVGRSLDWFLDVWCDAPRDDARSAAFAQLDAEAATVAPGAAGIRFVPFLGGHSAAAGRPDPRGTLSGLRLSHRRAHLYRAVLEGGAFAVRGIWDRVVGWCGEPAVARFTGGGTLSRTWPQIIVDVIGRPIEVVDEAVEARGAAIYAAVAAGFYPDVDAAAAAMVHPTSSVQPDADRSGTYEIIYADWCRLAAQRAGAGSAAEGGKGSRVS